MTRRVVLGVDSSTQSTKVEARDLATGEVLGRGWAQHRPTTPPVSEQDPRVWWVALVAAVAQLGDARADVVGVSVAGQQHGLVLLDVTGTPVRPAKLWNDTTSSLQTDRLVAALGAERWAELTGSVPVPSLTITKLAWVAEHEPELLGRATRVMLPHDYLTWRLTGNHVTDRGDASGTGWFDAVGNRYLPELVELAAPGWDGALPTVLGPTDPAGTLTDAAAAELGLPAGIAVGPGTGDNAAAALGLGLLPGDVAVSLGTSGVVLAVSPTPTRDPAGFVAGFASASGDYLPLVCTLNATKVTDTVARWLGVDAAGLADLALAGVASGTDGPVLVPYFDGERTPNLPDATGTWFGLTNSTTREQLALAAHDGVLCGLLDGLDHLRTCGATVGGRMFLVGGGARSAAYRQRLADLAAVPVVVADTDEAVATGAAVQAAMVLGEPTSAWNLGTGTTVSPRTDGAATRARYAAATH
ncbi:MAG TPA: xylulokinase [Ilumatobacter sp.]|nr:xylulokinase [Ilumatobacter sp.]